MALVAPRVSKGRVTLARSAYAVVSTERPPVILEWTSCLVRVGYAEQHKPQHIVPWTLNHKDQVHDVVVAQQLATTETWYQIIGPLLDQIFNFLLMIPPSTRRVVVLHPPYMERTWENAMIKGLYNLGVPAVVLVHSLETVHLAMGWSRGMVVQVGMKETWCMAHVDGHSLHHTLQGEK
jgi:actin-related protein